MDRHDLNMAIAQQLKAINDVAGPLIAGLLSDDVGAEEQLAFAHRLVDVAELIRQRATGETSPMVVEGSVSDDCDRRALPGGG